MGITLKKNSTDITSNIDTKSLVLTSVLTKEVGRLQFTIKTYGSKATCAPGDQIDLYEDSNHLFGGTITESESVVQGGILIGIKYTANDWSYRLNTKLVVKSYADMDPADIVADILTYFTDGTYTTTNVVRAGFNVSSIKFNYEQVTVALEKLAKQIGWEWYVDADKDLHFFPPTTVVNAPYVIDDTSGNLEWATLDVDMSVVNMKNSIYVVGGQYTRVYDATTTPDKYLTDGTKTVFSLAYTYDPTTIIVTLDGVAKAVGTDQSTDPTTVDVLYNAQSRFIRFTTTPTTGKTVKVYGNAQIPILAHVQNQTAIALYGEKPDIIIDQQISSVIEAQQRANVQISQYGSPVYTVRFSTLSTGFRIGQTVSVNSTLFGTNALVVIKRITGRMFSPTQMRYDIQCVGSDQVTFVDIMKLLLTQGQAQTVVSDATVLQMLLLVTETLASSDTLNAPTSKTGPYYWNSTPGSGQVGVWNFATWSA